MRKSMMAALGMAVVALAVGAVIAADAQDAKKDLEKLRQGTWALVSGERDGKKFTEEEVKKTMLFIKDQDRSEQEAEGDGCNDRQRPGQGQDLAGRLQTSRRHLRGLLRAAGQGPTDGVLFQSGIRPSPPGLEAGEKVDRDWLRLITGLVKH
jgi:hypothetical protein